MIIEVYASADGDARRNWCDADVTDVWETRITTPDLRKRGNVKIGELASAYAGSIFAYCADLSGMGPALHKRYWTQVHMVQSRQVRVTGQWYDPNKVGTAELR